MDPVVRLLRQDSGNRVVRGVSLKDDRASGNEVGENGSGSETGLQRIEGGTCLFVEIPGNIFSGKTSKRDRDSRVVMNEPSVEVSKP